MKSVSMLIAAVSLGASRQPSTPPPPAGSVQAGQLAQGTSTDGPALDPGWPRQFETADQVVRIFQPQVESWKDFDRITFVAAVSVAPKGSDARAYGVMRVSANTRIAFEDRLVVLTDRKLESLAFRDADAQENSRLSAIVLAAAPPDRPQTIALDRLISKVDASTVQTRPVDVNLAPPRIFFSDRPAVLLAFMGKPRLKPLPLDNGEASGLMFAINTNWDLIFDPAAGRYYLLNDGAWLVATDLEKGPWQPAPSLPAALSRLPRDENWADVRSAVPGTPAAQVPAVFVSYEPAELIVTQREPEFEAIPGTSLMLVANTQSDLFYHPVERQFYLLTAGRWFRAASLSGPWTSSSASLPDDFRNIPEDSNAGDVLASVPGTPQANEAIISASIPNKATISRTELTVNVLYDGNPSFRPIEGTTVQYAFNSPYNVFLVDGVYYCCHNAVWFSSSTPTGVWTVCTSVPPAIYTIPPSSPKHNVTYVYVYESTPTTVVTGYTAGYSGATVAATGVVMFGLGVAVGAILADDDCCWHYHCHAHFFSYGCGARYHGPYGGFVCASRHYGPYGGAGRVAIYNPSTGVFSRAGFAYGPNGAVGFRAAYNPSTGSSAWFAGASTPYASWGRGAVTNGDEWVRGFRRSGSAGSVSGINTSGGAGAIHAENRWGNGVTIARDADGDLYAGKDGKVYRKTDSGWEQQSGSLRPAPNGPKPETLPAPAPNAPSRPEPAGNSRALPDHAGDLQKEATSRARGERNTTRTQRFQRGEPAQREQRPSGGRGSKR